MKLLSNDKWYLCFHWIYFLKWVIKEVLLQFTMSIKQPADNPRMLKNNNSHSHEKQMGEEKNSPRCSDSLVNFII